MLYEEYLRSSAIAGDSSSVARLFAPVGIVALLVIAALQVPLAWRMARRIRNAQHDRELLLQRAIDASEQERRVIASGLHDGVVQELAGHSFQMAAAIEQDSDETELRRVLATRRRRDAKRDPPAALAAARDLSAGAARPGPLRGAARPGRAAHRAWRRRGG